MIKARLRLVNFRILFLLVAALAVSQLLYGSVDNAIAGDNAWTPAGLQGTSVYSIALSRTFANDRTMFAATSNGVYRSTDAGGHWAKWAMDVSDAYAVAVSPAFASDKTVFVATKSGSLYWSRDGGIHWSKRNSTSTRYSGHVLVISPNYNRDKTLFYTASGDIYKSIDEGKTYSVVRKDTKASYIAAIAISRNYKYDKTVFLGEVLGNFGVYRSLDGGATWRRDRQTRAFWGGGVGALATSPNYVADKVVFAGGRGGLARSANGGSTWRHAGGDIETDRGDVLSIVVSPRFATDRTIYAGTSQGRVYKSIDSGFHFQRLSRGGLPGKEVCSLAIAPTYPAEKRLFAASENMALYSVVLSPDTLLATVPGAPDGKEGWFKTSPEISLSTDKPATTLYSWDAATTATTYSAPYQLPGEGIHNLRYRSLDSLGVSETTQTREFKLDETLPSNPTLITSTTHSIDTTSSTKTVEVDIRGAADMVSGVKGYAISWSRDETATPPSLVDVGTTESTSTIHLSKYLPDGKWYMNLKTRDVAGNWSEPTSFGPLIIRGRPGHVLRVNPEIPNGKNGWYRSAAQTTLSTDETATLYFQWDSTDTAGWTTHSTLSPLALTPPEGIHTLYYYSIDSDDETSTLDSKTYQKDTHAPTSRVAVPLLSSDEVTGDIFNVSWRAADQAPGSSPVTYNVDYKVLADGRWLRWKTGVTVTAAGFRARSQGQTHYFRVRAVDRAGNVSPYSPVRSTIVPLDDRRAPASIWFSAAGGFPDSYGTTLQRSYRQGAGLLYLFRGSKVYVVARKGPGRSQAAIFIDGKFRGVVDTYASGVKPRQRIFQSSVSGTQTHELVILNLATEGRQLLEIDAIGFLN